MFQNRREEEFTKPKLGFYLLYPVRFKVSIKKKSGKPKHGGGLSVTCWPSITPPPLKTAWCSVISPPCFTHQLHLKKVRSSANVPTWAAARWMSRKPRDSRCNHNMVPVDGSLGWKRPSVCWLELLDSDCVGGKEEGWRRGQRPV